MYIYMQTPRETIRQLYIHSRDRSVINKQREREREREGMEREWEGDSSYGGGGRRKASWRERENNRRRERRRRAIAAKIYGGLRAQANFNIQKHCDNNEVLKALCAQAGWIVEPDGTTYPKGSRPPPSSSSIDNDIGASSNTTTPSSSRPPSPPCSSFPTPIPSSSNPFCFMPYSSNPSSISNSAPVTPPLASSSTTPISMHNFNWDSIAKQSASLTFPHFLPVSAPATPTHAHHRLPPPPDSSTVDSGQWMRFKTHASTRGPTFYLPKPAAKHNISSQNAVWGKGKGIDFEFEREAVKAWEGERIHQVGLEDLELTLASGGRMQ